MCVNKDNEDSCIEDFQMISVTDQIYLDNYKADGLIGLSPEKSDLSQTNFLDVLKEEEVIENSVFSFHFNKQKPKENVITLGGYDSERFGSSELTWHSSKDDFYWLVDLASIRLGNNEFKPQSKKAIFDTGTSFLLVPDDDFYKLLEYFGHGDIDNCREEPQFNNFYSCYCENDNYDDFTIKIDDADYVL